MRKRVGFVVVAIAALVAVAWWWHGRERASHGGGGASVTAKATAAEKAARPSRVLAHPARVDGTVRDDQGAPIAGAVVQADGPDDEPIAVIADDGGAFTFAQLAPGPYRLLAGAPGFVPGRQTLELESDQRATAAFTLARGGIAVSGTVADTAGGPIEGALVIAVHADTDVERRAAGAAFSSPDGRYALSLAPGEYRLRVTHPEYVGAAAAVALATTPAVVDFALLPGATVDGIVKDVATGAPVPDAEIRVVRPGFHTWEGVGGDRARAGADGVFHLTGLAPGAAHLEARVEADSLDPVNPAPLLLGLGEQVSGVELWVQAVPYLAGKVVDASGAAVAKARVAVHCRMAADATVADDDGGFRFTGMPRGACTLTASGKRHRADKPVEVAIADAPVTGVIVPVLAAPMLHGRVDPPGPAAITVEHGPDHRGWFDPASAHAEAGADGTFELTPLVPGEHRLVARTDDGRRGTVTVAVPEAGTVETVIALAPGGRIAGRVRDDRGAAVAGATVLIKAPIAGEPLAEPERVRTDADGAFAANGLTAATYRLAVADERGGPMRWAGAADAAAARAPRKIELAAGEERTGVELTVVRDDGVITGVVRNPDGTPRADAWVSAALRWTELLQSSDPDDPMTSRDAAITTADGGDPEGAVPPVLTGPDGTFALRNLRVGRYDVTANAERGALHGATEKVRTGTDTVVKLAGLLAIDGTVTRDGAPVTDFTVDVAMFGPMMMHPLAFHDEQGRFHVGNLEPEMYRLRVDSPRGSGAATVKVKDKNATIEVKLVELAHVVGRVLDAHGQPFKQLMAFAMAPAGAPPVEGSFGGVTRSAYPDGRFELELSPGRYELVVSGPPGDGHTGVIFDAIGGQKVDLGTIVRP